MFNLQAERAVFGAFYSSDLISTPILRKFFATKNTEPMPDLKGMSLNLDTTKKKLPFDPKKEYDAVVIGGGTGGISFAQEARELGLSIAIFNYVQPTPKMGFKWGLGGTCVNVGWVPKKLFHNWGLIKESIHMAQDYGWDVELKDDKVKWEVLRDNIQDLIKGMNFSYVTKMREIGADYIEAKASINESQNVVFDLDDTQYELKAKNIVIATGGRPRYLPNIEGANFKFEEEWITSDDLFALEKNPGKTLVVGGGYIGKILSA